MKASFPSVPAAHLARSPRPDRPLRLLERVRTRLRLLHYSPRTEEAYCGWVRRYVLFHDRRHPSGELVRAKRGRRLPVVLSVGEVRAILVGMARVPRICATLLYGSGMRLSECISLRVKDVELDRHEITVRGGKGNRDRRVPLPAIAWRALQAQIGRVEKLLQRDIRHGVRGPVLPDALARKLPNAEREAGEATMPQQMA